MAMKTKKEILEWLPDWAQRPYYPPPPYHQPTRMLYAVWKCDPALLNSVVPEEFKIINNEVGGWHTVYPLSTKWGTFRESAIAVRVKYENMVGLYFIQLYLSGDVVMTNCREVYGFPKKIGWTELSTMAEPDRSKRQDLISGSVTRNGIELMSINMQIYEQVKPKDVPLGDHFFNLKVSPSVDYGHSLPDVVQLTEAPVENVVFQNALKGPATVKFNKSPVDPLWRFEPKSDPVGYYLEFDFDLPGGQVLKEYK